MVGKTEHPATPPHSFGRPLVCLAMAVWERSTKLGPLIIGERVKNAYLAKHLAQFSLLILREEFSQMNSSLGRMRVIHMSRLSSLFHDSCCTRDQWLSRAPPTTGLRKKLCPCREPVLASSTKAHTCRWCDSEPPTCHLPSEPFPWAFAAGQCKDLESRKQKWGGGPRPVPTSIRVSPCTEVCSEF